MSKFTVAGVSTHYGVTKVRFANDIVTRTKILSKGTHTSLVELIELPKAMTKAEACQHLLDAGGVFVPYTELIIETMAKKEGTPAKAKVVKATPVKAVAQTTAKIAKVAKPVVEDDLEIEEIKELADAPL
jgi:hypothetical protein